MFPREDFKFESIVRQYLHEKHAFAPSIAPCFNRSIDTIGLLVEEEKEYQDSYNDDLIEKYKISIRRAIRTFKEDEFQRLTYLEKFLLGVWLFTITESEFKKRKLVKIPDDDVEIAIKLIAEKTKLEKQIEDAFKEVIIKYFSNSLF